MKTEQPNVSPHWVVYDNPTDYPGEFVARLWLIEAGNIRTTDLIIRAPTLEEVRALLPVGLCRLDRAPTDEPQIVESWI